MGGSEDGTENHANASDDHIGDTEEGVLAAHDSSRGDKDGLGASILRDGEHCAII